MASAAKRLAMKRREHEEREWEKQRQMKQKAAMWEDQAGTVARNVLSDFAAFAKFDRNDENLKLIMTAPGQPSWTPALATFVYDVTKENMQSLYDATPGFEWKDGKKRAELLDTEGRYIVALRLADSEPVGFISFRFLLENAFDVLYVYELQLGKAAQRKGVGKHLMQVCELIARKQGMQFVMLTVLSRNEAAASFYTNKMKYTIDPTSPSQEGDMTAGYEILSKCINPAATAEVRARYE